MGHERVGMLPRSKQWRQIVSDISLAAHSDDVLRRVADSTLRQVRDRFEQIHKDPGVHAAFGFLVGLSASHLPPLEANKASPPVELGDRPSILRLATELNAWVEKHAGSLEYAELAKRAGADAIASWTKDKARQRDLFSPEIDTQTIWRSASTGAGFCEVSRIFFASFVERYLKYFLEREASAELSTLAEREQLSRRLEGQIDAFSHHAFETTRIAQSFAAGWFNKRMVQNRRPTDNEIKGFLSFAFGKLRQEFQREAME